MDVRIPLALVLAFSLVACSAAPPEVNVTNVIEFPDAGGADPAPAADAAPNDELDAAEPTDATTHTDAAAPRDADAGSVPTDAHAEDSAPDTEPDARR